MGNLVIDGSIELLISHAMARSTSQPPDHHPISTTHQLPNQLPNYQITQLPDAGIS
jgi:hypothetical protein